MVFVNVAAHSGPASGRDGRLGNRPLRTSGTKKNSPKITKGTNGRGYWRGSGCPPFTKPNELKARGGVTKTGRNGTRTRPSSTSKSGSCLSTLGGGGRGGSPGRTRTNSGTNNTGFQGNETRTSRVRSNGNNRGRRRNTRTRRIGTSRGSSRGSTRSTSRATREGRAGRTGTQSYKTSWRGGPRSRRSAATTRLRCSATPNGSASGINKRTSG